MASQPQRLIVGGEVIDLIGEDLLQNILARLPAASFASAASVSGSWSLVCGRILSRPKLSSAISFNPSLQVAVEEVFNKVLSEPIRPHFAIASVGPSFSLQQAHKLVQWEITEDDNQGNNGNSSPYANRAIALTIGYMPGLKVIGVPLLQSNELHEGNLLEVCHKQQESRVSVIDEFVMDIMECSASISDSTSPTGIVMFADPESDMKPVLEKMDYAMSQETVIVGDGNGKFLYRGVYKKDITRSPCESFAAVALLFIKNREKIHGIGETQFHVTLSTGLSPIGPTYKAASVREIRDECYTWLTARREGSRENLDGQTILDHIYGEIGERIQYPAFYIGVIKRRKCSIGLDKARWITSCAFHEVLGGDEEYLYAGDSGIKTGDSFRFYHSDSNTALSSCSNISANLRCLKQDCNHANTHNLGLGAANCNKKEVFGGFIFSCCGRGESFFGQPNIDSSPFLENFPGVTLAGSFCGGEIGRGDLSLYGHESQDQGSIRCCLHVFSSVCLVMSYTPPLLEH
ncbi:hypothetical protein RJ639_022073 [Escallonia herrerae]|uniref:FIST C-domain domain-containing protein n=1 Tax=Escallonia herrerae TaxID=1293975 RepID=A0AA88V5T0_9ASTE|nr:hypothetical protein RJ639_022073 [Escallonia herrerae]